MRLRMLPDQSAEGLLGVRAAEGLQVVQQDRLAVKGRLRGGGLQRVPAADGVGLQQDQSRSALAAAAGRAEQDHLPLGPRRLEPLLQCGCYYDSLLHIPPPLFYARSP